MPCACKTRSHTSLNRKCCISLTLTHTHTLTHSNSSHSHSHTHTHHHINRRQKALIAPAVSQGSADPKDSSTSAGVGVVDSKSTASQQVNSLPLAHELHVKTKVESTTIPPSLIPPERRASSSSSSSAGQASPAASSLSESNLSESNTFSSAVPSVERDTPSTTQANIALSTDSQSGNEHRTSVKEGRGERGDSKISDGIASASASKRHDKSRSGKDHAHMNTSNTPATCTSSVVPRPPSPSAREKFLQKLRSTKSQSMKLVVSLSVYSVYSVYKE